MGRGGQAAAAEAAVVEDCCGEAPSLVGRDLWLLCLLRGSGGEAGRVEAGGGVVVARAATLAGCGCRSYVTGSQWLVQSQPMIYM